MRTNDEWQAREAELLAANNRYLERARKAENSLKAAHAGKPTMFWNANDPETSYSDIEELLDNESSTWNVVEIDVGYAGPKVFAALAWSPDGSETTIVETHSREECQRLVDLAKQACEEYAEQDS